MMYRGKKIVVSGINIFQAGALTIYYGLLDCMIKNGCTKKNSITIFVNKKELFSKYKDKVNVIELPKSRKSYLYRMYYEYVYFWFYSIGKNIDIWLSLHDMTPNVMAKKRYVYCHNPLPFITEDMRRYLCFNVKSSLIQRLYKYIYKVNIKKNDAVIVQQEWIRKEFRKMFDIKDIIVARPTVNSEVIISEASDDNRGRYSFIYAAYPRDFKNFEVICNAAVILKKRNVDCEIQVTINGTENEYAKKLYDKYNDITNIKWMGLLDKKMLNKAYADSDCLIFPSLLETWGLPITEYKLYNKDILCADLPYAHETVGNYEKKRFFNPMDPEELARLMEEFIKGDVIYDKEKVSRPTGIIYNSWFELINAIFY